MNDIILEAIKVVDDLNYLYFDLTKDEECVPFKFIYTPYWMGIEYGDTVVWDDQDNDVSSEEIFDEDDNWVRTETQSIIDKVQLEVLAIHSKLLKFKMP